MWHGLNPDVLDNVLEDGFNTNYASLEFNPYGAGIYFAPDPKLSDFFIRSARGSLGEKKIILSRVACGSIGVRSSIRGSQGQIHAALRDPKNRNPSAGHTSATGRKHT